MNVIKNLAAAASAAALVFAAPPAMASTGDNAENLRRLNIMLMVTSLRCRLGPDDFQPEYQLFSATHLDTLNNAARELEANLVSSHGPVGAHRALDRMSVGMANEYGRGHPWLECGALKQITYDLAGSRNIETLHLAAAELLAPYPGGAGHVAAR